jgi:stage V sporulation protein AA
MEESKTITVYVKAELCTVVTKKKVLIEDVVQLFGTDQKLIKQLNNELLMVVPKEEKRKYIFSVLKVLELLSKQHPKLEFNNIGKEDFIVEYIPPKRKNKALELAKTAFVCLAVFFGSAFTIMTFNQDVAVAEVFRLFEDMVFGGGTESGIIEITYSVGLPLGIIFFFNHFSRLKMSSDPTPLQVQLRVYEENVNKAIIENASRENKTID